MKLKEEDVAMIGLLLYVMGPLAFAVGMHIYFGGL